MARRLTKLALRRFVICDADGAGHWVVEVNPAQVGDARVQAFGIDGKSKIVSTMNNFLLYENAKRVATQEWVMGNSITNNPISYSATNPGSQPDLNTAPANSLSFVYGDALNGPGFRCNVLDFYSLAQGYRVQLAMSNSASQPMKMAFRCMDNGVWQNSWTVVGSGALSKNMVVGTNTAQLVASTDCTGVIINCVFHYGGVPPTPGTFVRTATATVTVDGVSIGTATNSLSTNYGNIGFSQSFEADGMLLKQFNTAIAAGSTVAVVVQVQGYLHSADIQMTLI